ncbi:hypothetical protein ACEN88_28825, partial [Massilia sp. CT11-108]|uniref:hypothetical protein n=1 Tax=Massilia sp. CT11-108 TaxID=3393900 RepID=UPI0039A6A6DE
MTTTSFNPQLNTANGINQRPNTPGNGGSDGSQFSALLRRGVVVLRGFLGFGRLGLLLRGG